MNQQVLNKPIASPMGQQATSLHGILIILAAVMPAMAIISLVPVVPLLMQEFAAVPGVSFLVPIAMTIPALCIAIFSPAAGWLSDRVGRKPVLICALVAYGLIGLLPYFLTQLHWIIVSRVFLGIAEAAIMTVATALIGDYFSGKKRERWIAIQIASVSVSAIFLIAIGGLLGETLGSRGPFLLYLIALPVALVASIFLFEPAQRQDQGEGVSRKILLSVLPVAAATLFVGIIFYIVIVKMGEILALAGEVTPAMIGILGAGANIGVAAGSMASRKFQKHSTMLPILLGLSMATVGYMVSSAALNLTVTSLAIFVACLGFGTLIPTMLSLTLSKLPDNVRGRGTGIWTGAFFLGQFAAPLIITAIQVATGTLASALLTVGIITGCMLVISLFMRQRAQ